MAPTKAGKVLCVVYAAIAACALVATWRNGGLNGVVELPDGTFQLVG